MLESVDSYNKQSLTTSYPALGIAVPTLHAPPLGRRGLLQPEGGRTPSLHHNLPLLLLLATVQDYLVPTASQTPSIGHLPSPMPSRFSLLEVLCRTRRVRVPHLTGHLLPIRLLLHLGRRSTNPDQRPWIFTQHLRSSRIPFHIRIQMWVRFLDIGSLCNSVWQQTEADEPGIFQYTIIKSGDNPRTTRS